LVAPGRVVDAIAAAGPIPHDRAVHAVAHVLEIAAYRGAGNFERRDQACHRDGLTALQHDADLVDALRPVQFPGLVSYLLLSDQTSIRHRQLGAKGGTEAASDGRSGAGRKLGSPVSEVRSHWESGRAYGAVTLTIFIAFVPPETPSMSPFVKITRSPTSTRLRDSSVVKMSW